MVEEMKKYLTSVLEKVDGLLCILITDRDGVPLLKVVNEGIPESALRPSFISTFGMATDQASKLGLGDNKTVVCFYSKYQVVHINKLPMVISLIAKKDTNTGHMLSLQNLIDPILYDLRPALIET